MVSSVYSQNNNQNNAYQSAAIGIAGTCIGWEAETYLRKACSYPLKKYVQNKIPKCAGGGYKEFLETAIKQNKLDDKFKIIDLNERNQAEVKKSLKVDFKNPKGIEKVIDHILRIPSNKSAFERTVQGKNAFFSIKDNAVVCNFEKLGAPIFHEIQHKLNSTSSNPLIKTLAHIRNPLAVLGPLVISSCAMFTKQKKCGEKEGLNDKIKNNCGILVALSFLPLTIEECIANVKGTKIAQKAGVTGELLKKVKFVHKLSIINYCAMPIIAGLAVWGGKNLRDYICKNEIQ